MSSIVSFFSSFVSTVHNDAPEEKEPEVVEEAAAEEEEEPEDVCLFCLVETAWLTQGPAFFCLLTAAPPGYP